jgi:hypothetical protein
MINLLPEPKIIRDDESFSKSFDGICLTSEDDAIDLASLRDIAAFRFWNYKDIELKIGDCADSDGMTLHLAVGLDDFEVEEGAEGLFKSQGYHLLIEDQAITLHYENKAGFINGLTSVKMLLQEAGEGVYHLPCCEITDWPSIPVRAIAPTFSWYAGYGRIGFDSQLWGYDEWVQYLNICLDNKINQFNLLMYGYWPIELEDYPETVFSNVPVEIWNDENRRWLKIRYTHPNLEEPFLDKFIDLAHSLEVNVFAYVGLNSYNGAYTIAHPEARMKPPETEKFLNDFDSLCLSYPGNVDYIIDCMVRIAELGFDGYTLEESEEGFWFCECDQCKKRWHDTTETPGEAKHKANLWLLNRIYEAVREVNPEIVLGIRAFRQPPLEKSPAFLQDCVDSMPDDINLFWAPGLYVPESEFEKWCNAFGRHRIWARDTESNAITSTMGRLYRTFESNVIRYEDEPNVQVIERDIEQHRGSVRMGVHGINGFMFEWYGLFLHLFAHGNYGWGSMMEMETFFKRACELNFGPELGEKILYVMKNIVTIHESQINLYTTPFPFQKNKMTKDDIPAIMAAKANHPHLMKVIEEIQETAYNDPKPRAWLPHFDKWHNAERRNAVIYDLVLAAIRYDNETDPDKKDAILDEILWLNQKDFDIAKEMFFDINPVSQTGVKSCMFPYHEMKRLIHNIRHPEDPDDDIICSGIEALGWLWL